MRVRFGEYQLDTEARTLERQGRRISVQAKAFDLLAYVIERRERVVSGDELLDALWPDTHVTPAALSTAVQKARQAVGDDGERQAVLHTEHGKGFRFVAEVTQLPGADETPAPAAARAQRRRAAAAAGVAVLLAAAAAAWLLARPAPQPAPAPGHSLAVLPFVNMSADPDQQYFAEGISEELLNTVARFDGLRVVGRTSSFSFRNSDADLKSIGESLGADVILEGSVRASGDRVRITAQLVDAEDGYHRWSETYDRELTDIFALQTEIATDIATALRLQLSPEQSQRLATPPTRNLAAYQAYLLGMRHLDLGASADLAEAIEHFQRAIGLDPELALAHVGLTRAYLEQFQYSDRPPDDVLARAQAAANRALELDDQLAEAHAAIAQVAWWRNDFEEAEAAFRRALAIDSDSITVNLLYGNFLSVSLDRYEEALAFNQKAVELDPLSLEAIWVLAVNLGLLGRFDESLIWLQRALEIDPDNAAIHLQIANHHWGVSGRLDEAMVWAAQAVALDPENPANLTFVGNLLLDLGDPDRAEAWTHRAFELAPESFYPNLAMLALALYRGDENRALEHGRRALAIWPLDAPVLSWMGALEIRAGRDGEARALYEEFYPELLESPDPQVDRRTYRVAIDLALILSRTGEQERASALLDRSLAIVEARADSSWKDPLAEAQIYALQDRKREALSSLRTAIDQGWRAWWWRWFQRPELDPLRDEPEFQAMLKEVRADSAAQLARVREMERDGELTLTPEPGASAD